MRRRMIALGAVGALALGTMAMSPPDGAPGPIGPNDVGLCTAWDANENGRDNGRADEAPPFEALHEVAEGEIGEWCDDVEHPGGGDRQGPPNGS